MPSIRRLIDLPGVADLEHKALMRPAIADPDQRADYPEADDLSKSLFGLTREEAEDVERPAGSPRIERLTPSEQADMLELLGWDVTDDKRRPLRLLRQFNLALWLAASGLAGELPFAPEPQDKDEGDWAARMAADAKRFRKR